MAEKRVKLFSNSFMAGAFALCNFVLVLLLMWTVGTEYAPEWKKYQSEYYRLYAERVDDPELKQKILSTPLEIQQIWLPDLEVTDRCTTCHLGVENPVMTDVPQPYRVHPDFTQHTFRLIGCTVCHEGQGVATTTHAAHVMEDLHERFGPYDEQHAGWSRPMLPLEYVQSSCNKCHNVMEAPVPGADHLNAGWQQVQEKGCMTCHMIGDMGANQAPELTTVGTKFFNASGYSEAYHDARFGYLKESLRCPQANMSEEAAEACRADLIQPLDTGTGEGTETLSGEELVAKYQCNSCHSFDAPQKLVGPSLYDIGQRQDEAYIREAILEPDAVVAAGFPPGVMKATLGGVNFYQDVQQNPAIVDNLVRYLSDLKGDAAADKAEPASTSPAAATIVMPNFGFSDDELHNVVTFLLGLREETVPWPQMSFAQVADAESNGQAAADAMLVAETPEALFTAAGCNACHKVDGPERLVGPSLWDIGARQDKVYIRESILEPDKYLVPGYPPAVMKTTLEQTGFYQKLSLQALEDLVDYLSSLKGSS